MNNDKPIFDENNNEVSNPDLSIGYLVEETIVKKNAEPIDNKTKFAWYDEDYEQIYRYIVIPEPERIQNRIIDLKEKLSNTDYIVAKVVEGVSTWDDYPGIKDERQSWRNEINELQSKLSKEE